MVCAHSGIEVSNQYEFFYGWDLLDDVVEHPVEVLFDVVFGIKGWCVSADDGGEASLCEGKTPRHQSFIDWEGGGGAQGKD